VISLRGFLKENAAKWHYIFIFFWFSNEQYKSLQIISYRNFVQLTNNCGNPLDISYNFIDNNYSPPQVQWWIHDQNIRFPLPLFRSHFFPDFSLVFLCDLITEIHIVHFDYFLFLPPPPPLFWDSFFPPTKRFAGGGVGRPPREFFSLKF